MPTCLLTISHSLTHSPTTTYTCLLLHAHTHCLLTCEFSQSYTLHTSPPTHSLTPTTKELNTLEERVKKIESKTHTPKKKRKRSRNADQAERTRRRRRIKPAEEVVAEENTPRVVSRPPTPMVPPTIAGRSWWGGHGVAPQAYVGSDVAPRGVRTTPPTPHFISPVYASRNFIR